MKVRLYGLSEGQGSFSRVTRGMKQGLEACGVLAGFFPIDAFQEDAVYGGHDAEYGVYVGPPGDVGWMENYGWHKHRLCLFPPNSTWVPRTILDKLAQHITGLIAPSTWAQTTLKVNSDLPIHLWHHGVSEAFYPIQSVVENRRRLYDQGTFRVAHFASTSMERKGTRELIEAWCRLVTDRKLGPNPELNLMVDGNQSDFAEAILRYGNKRPAILETVHWRGRLNFSEEEIAPLYRSQHLVAQPSRGEGFGLCTLEARACGTPVLMTQATGHLDQVDGQWGSTKGVALVGTGPVRPIDDGPDALAPSLSVEDVADALEIAYSSWTFYADAAVENAISIAKDWNWEEVTERWLDTLVGAD